MRASVVLAVLCGLAVCALVQAASPDQACVPPNDKYVFCNTSLSIAARVKNLVGQLSLGEKVQQLVNQAAGISRLNIPAFQWWREALHGAVIYGCYNNHCPSSYPCALNMAASFNMDLVYQVGTAISDEGRAAYNQDGWGPVVWAPNINIFRDPRWGRGQETPGEDPYLSGRYGIAFVQGLQGNDPKYLKLVATPKHFAAYSLEQMGNVARQNFDAKVSKQDLAQTFFPAFATTVQVGGAKGIMCSYNSINGVPSCANPLLLTDTLRSQWAFDGYVTSDCDAIVEEQSTHNWAPSVQAAAARSLNAGCDQDCDDNVYKNNLQQAINQGLTTEAQVDVSLSRLYTLHMKLGMYDPAAGQPYANLNPTATLDNAAHRALARKIATESLILLKNDGGLLPLHSPSSLKVALIGPHAAATNDLTSNYAGYLPPIVSIQQGLKNIGVNVNYQKGCDINSATTSGIASAVSAAQSSDVAIVCLGINGDLEGEGKDRSSIALPGQQNSLLSQVLAVQPKTIVVLVNGGMVGVETVIKAPAVIEAFYPSEEGGNAVADVLFGRYNPSGRLPVTIYPSNFTNDNDYFSYDMRKAPGMTYRFYQRTPMFEFGYGLSYTTFSYAVLAPTSQSVSAQLDASTTFDVKVTNTGGVDGDVSVLAFLRLIATATASAVSPRQLVDSQCPLRQLFSFQKITLAAAASKVLHFAVTPADALCVDKQGNRIALEGTYELQLGDARATFIVGQAGPCANVSCGTHGSCVNGACVCKDGFSGAACEVPPADPCVYLQCGAHGTCDKATASCVCSDQYTGAACDIAPPPPPEPAATICATAGEGSQAALICPRGNIITAIQFASYGVPSGSCPSFSTGSCHATTSVAQVQAACLGQSSCYVSASNDVFGDPCSGTGKTLAVAVYCSSGASSTAPSPPPPAPSSTAPAPPPPAPSSTAPSPPPPAPSSTAPAPPAPTTICATASEGQQASLTCPAGNLISAITFASYGVPSGTCPSFSTGSCHASSSLAQVQSACVGQSSCTVAASNNVFGDPCSGTGKTLDIAATCSAGSPSPATTICATAAEGQQASLSCPAGKNITAITFASYGLPSGSCPSFTVSSSCDASSSLAQVKSACVGQNSCTVAASNNVFGDPCSGRGKTLDIAAQCN